MAPPSGPPSGPPPPRDDPVEEEEPANEFDNDIAALKDNLSNINEKTAHMSSKVSKRGEGGEGGGCYG